MMSESGLHIRVEETRDHEATFAINKEAFETSAEALLVNTLRQQAAPLLSLVAELDGELVGHIMFSPITHSEAPDLQLMGLAPMAVRSELQRCGVGSALVHEGLERLRKRGVDGVVVLGHPEYYPRFGFTSAAGFGIDSEYDVPDDVFMALELYPGALSDQAGRVSYHGAFKAI